MPTPFFMPKFDMDQEKATIITWLKAEGDNVAYDEAVLTVETDKVAIDVPSPAKGKLVRISAKAGDVVPVTTVIAYILAEGESEASLPPPGSPPEKITSAQTASIQAPVIPDRTVIKETERMPIKATPVAARMAQSLGVDLAAVPARQERVTKADVQSYVQESIQSTEKIPATPAARRLARELGIDLGRVAGRGPEGRVQAADVNNYAESARLEAPALVPATTASPERRAELVPLAGIRLTIAQRMQVSFQTAPHIALTVEADLSSLENTRQRMNELAARYEKSKVSVTALLVRITAWALERHPYLNASLVDETIYLWKDINMGVAIAIPGGLIVPVIKNANLKTTGQINDELKDLAERARANRLSLEEVKGGTFTISNLGMYGIHQFRAVINPPESAILAVGSVMRKPVVIDEKDTIAVRPILTMTISADHRVIDGVAAAEFLSDLVKAVENPDLLLY
jgi:pyruvate dehydrogenase E2 component (dihydrolipoamide acetyltransferase)